MSMSIRVCNENVIVSTQRLVPLAASGNNGKHRRGKGSFSSITSKKKRPMSPNGGSHRAERVASQLEREVSLLLQNDRRLRGAVRPDEYHGLDSAMAAVASCTGVEVSRDLSLARISISIASDSRGREAAWRNLVKLTGHLRSRVAARPSIKSMRRIPELRLVEDDGLREGARVARILEQLKQESIDQDRIWQSKMSSSSSGESSGSESEDKYFWTFDDENEDNDEDDEDEDDDEEEEQEEAEVEDNYDYSSDNTDGEKYGTRGNE